MVLPELQKVVPLFVFFWGYTGFALFIVLYFQPSSRAYSIGLHLFVLQPNAKP